MMRTCQGVSTASGNRITAGGVSDSLPAQNGQSATASPPKSLLPETYGDPAKSGLTAEVVGGKANVFEFDLKK